MDYYKLLQLDREPFSNSPDPEYFFQSRQHHGCMQKLELALRLKRGLNVVIGDVGTGKTTLCRQLIRNFSRDETFESHLILDPSFDSAREFLVHIHDLLCDGSADETASEAELKEQIKQTLLHKGVDLENTIVLIIDEGQKISAGSVEILREFLNFETNTFKLLQIVIFAQLEFDQILDAHANFSDRINLLYRLEPMNFKDTRQMVHHRLKLSSTVPRPKKLFSLPAMWAIYRASNGYPRKIIHLCHQSMLAMIIQNRSKAGWGLIQSCRRRIAPELRPRRRILLTGVLAALAAIALLVYAPAIVNRQPPSERTEAIKVPQASTVEQIMAQSPPTAMAIAKPPQPAAEENPPPAEATPVQGEPPAAEATGAPNAPEPPEAASPPAPIETAAVAVEPEPPADAPAPAPAGESSPPLSLGKVLVRPGDTLVAMVSRVYGSFQNRYLNAVMETNTYIEDPNRIAIGDIIEFPTLPVQVKPSAKEAYWVVLEEFMTLPSAVQRLHAITRDMPIPLQVMPSWSPDNGLRFQLLVRGFFTDSPAASNYVQALPESVAGQGHVLSQWPEDSILYSDPYGSGSH